MCAHICLPMKTLPSTVSGAQMFNKCRMKAWGSVLPFGWGRTGTRQFPGSDGSKYCPNHSFMIPSCCKTIDSFCTAETPGHLLLPVGNGKKGHLLVSNDHTVLLKSQSFKQHAFRHGLYLKEIISILEELGLIMKRMKFFKRQRWMDGGTKQLGWHRRVYLVCFVTFMWCNQRISVMMPHIVFFQIKLGTWG